RTGRQFELELVVKIAVFLRGVKIAAPFWQTNEDAVGRDFVAIFATLPSVEGLPVEQRHKTFLHSRPLFRESQVSCEGEYQNEKSAAQQHGKFLGRVNQARTTQL